MLKGDIELATENQFRFSNGWILDGLRCFGISFIQLLCELFHLTAHIKVEAHWFEGPVRQIWNDFHSKLLKCSLVCNVLPVF